MSGRKLTQFLTHDMVILSEKLSEHENLCSMDTVAAVANRGNIYRYIMRRDTS